MLVIGIVGGVASGKSLVADYFRRLGAELIDADHEGHQVLREREVETAIRDRWGDLVFEPDGRVDRKALAKIVFAPHPEGQKELAFLEQITHPRIGQRLRRRIEQLRSTATAKIAVLDAAVMFKAGWDTWCDKIVFVEVPRPIRWERCQQRGWSQPQFAARESAQRHLGVKRHRADFVIDNSGSTEDTYTRIQRIWSSLLE